MTPAEQRVSELIDKWLKSLELHLTYTNLTDEAYWQVQPWVRHQRPARWILDLAQSRAHEVQRLLAARIASGDQSFSEALELVAFLANLVGVQSIERFIPLAEPERENPEVLGNTHSTLQPISATSTQTRTLIEPTREMRAPSVPAADSATMPAPAFVAPPEPPPPPPPPSPPPSLRAGFTPVLESKLAPRGRPPPPTHVFPVPPPAAPDAGAAYLPPPAPAAPARYAPPPSPPQAAPPPPPPSPPPPPPVRSAPAVRPWRPQRSIQPEPAPAPAARAAPATASVPPRVPPAPAAPREIRAAEETPAAMRVESRRGEIPEAIIPPRPRVPFSTPQPPPPAATRDAEFAPPAAPASPAPAIPVLSAADVAVEQPAARAPRAPAARPAAGGRGAAAGGRGSGKREARGAKAKPPAPGSLEAQVIADAVRLIKWGREWHELAEAIARIAGRPSVVEVRKLLRTYKSEVERAAAE